LFEPKLASLATCAACIGKPTLPASTRQALRQVIRLQGRIRRKRSAREAMSVEYLAAWAITRPDNQAAAMR
jgi:hypothetical protein